MSTTSETGPTTIDARIEAVMARDVRADGSFVYAVRTTGVYCRPSCPARRPARRNLVLFESGDDAEAAGFRACRRCRPQEVGRQEQAVARAQALLDGDEPPATLAELAAGVGMSPHHLHRSFKRRTGLTPKGYLRAARGAKLEARLEEGAGASEAGYDAGYGSAHALYRHAGRALGMTPGTFARGGDGARVAYGAFDTRLGSMLLAATPRGVCALHFGVGDERLVEVLRRDLPRAELEHDPAAVARHVEAVRAYLDGPGRALELPLDVAASEFQAAVWEALRRIPAGETRSYREVAEMIGRPTAVRAVARACAANPVALAIPCHRVVRTGGELGGYRWGTERKRTLLAAEGARGTAAEVGAARDAV